MDNSLSYLDLVDIEKVSPRIVLDIRYATQKNFIGRQLYTQSKAFLRRSVAHRLTLVQNDLTRQGLGLKVWDAYRPLSVQYSLWEIMPDERYVADPQKGSAHNRGAAVDVTLVNDQGQELCMPTDFDDFTKRAHLDFQELDPEVLANRELLTDAMMRRGFCSIATEWWHFSDPDAVSYPLESITFEELSERL